MHVILRRSSLVLALGTLAACGGADEPAGETPEAVVAEQPGAMEGMQGMGGMEGMQPAGADPLDAHMQMMEGASAEALVAMLPEHRQLVANRIAQYNREMRGMDMTKNTEWNSTVDALRQDLVRLPEMSADELKAFLPEHQGRIDRLTAMHREMMSDMQM